MSDLFLDLDQLNQPADRANYNRQRLFDHILRRCHRKILKFSKELKRKECTFDPPSFILGKPPYDFGQMVNYLWQSLTNNGFYVQWSPKRAQFYISWNPELAGQNYYRHNPQVPGRTQDSLVDLSPEEEFRDHLKSMITPDPNLKKNGRKSKKKDPSIQQSLRNVAIIEYDHGVKDIIPVNPKALK